MDFHQLTMRLFILMLFAWASVVCLSQKLPTAPNKVDASGRRQGKWVVLLTEEWKETLRQDSATYYRSITYKDDIPSGLVRDYYRWGTMQFEGNAIKDRPSLVYDGICTWFWENGTKKNEGRFEKGVLKEITIQHIRNGQPADPKFGEINSKAIGLADEGKYGEAEATYLEALEHIEALKGKWNRDFIQVEKNLIDNYFSTKNYKEISLRAKEVVRLEKRVLPPKDSTILEDYDSWGLGATLSGAGRAELITIYEQGVAEGRKRHPSPVFPKLLASLADQYAREERYGDARPLLEKAKDLWPAGDKRGLNIKPLYSGSRCATRTVRILRKISRS